MFVEFLAQHHDRTTFDCGKEPLNRFLRTVARQNADRNLGVTYVVVPEPGATEIAGYFTLVTRAVEANLVPEKHLPDGQVGVVLLGRLAVDKAYQRQRLGKRMLLRAMAETELASRRVGIYALILDAIDEEARSWYLRLNLGFKEFSDNTNRLYVRVSFIQKLQIGPLTSDL